MTKNIIFIRHAKSDWNDWTLSDFDRPLNERGKRDLPAMAKKWSTVGYQPEMIIASSAVRARETGNHFAKHFGIPILYEDNIYHSMPDVYLDHIQDLNEEISSIALVGHNPGISYLANLIDRSLDIDMPTCGILIATSDAKSWSEVTFENMEFKRLLAPKD